MRRKDREITDKKQIRDFIEQEKIIRIAFYDNEDIYIVPVNYGFCCDNDDYRFYFHGAKSGRKFELSKKRSSVGFEIDGRYKLLSADKACNFSAEFQSVIGTGIISIVEDKEEKVAGLNLLMKQTTGKTDWEYKEEEIDAVAVFKIDVQKMTCKAK